MKKKILFLLLCIMTVFMATVFASEDVIEVQFNGEYIDFTDELGNKVEPELINDRTMVPMRKIFETLGMEVIWSPSAKTVTAKNENKTITLAIDSTLATVAEGEETKTITLDAAPLLLNDRTMVPVRFIAESLDKQVGWDEKNRVVVIIDYTDILNEVEENCSTYLAMVQEQTVAINTFDIDCNFTGKLDYKDLEDRDKNQTLNFNGKVNIKKSETAVALSLNLNMKGEGLLYEAAKQSNLNSCDVDILIDENGDMYIKSSLLKENTNGKWVKMPETINLLESLNKLNNTNTDNLNEMFVLPEESLTKDSYQELRSIVDAFTKIFGNDSIKVSGTKTKTYTISFKLQDVFSSLLENNKNLAGDLNFGSLELEIKNTYKDGTNTKAELKLDGSIQEPESKEKVTLTFESDAKFNSYNKSVKITLPKASEIFEG